MVMSIRTNAGAMIALQMLAGGAAAMQERDRLEALKPRPDPNRVTAPTIPTARGMTSMHGRSEQDLARLARAEAKRQRKLAKKASPHV